MMNVVLRQLSLLSVINFSMVLRL